MPWPDVSSLCCCAAGSPRAPATRSTTPNPKRRSARTSAIAFRVLEFGLLSAFGFLFARLFHVVLLSLIGGVERVLERNQIFAGLQSVQGGLLGLELLAGVVGGFD